MKPGDKVRYIGKRESRTWWLVAITLFVLELVALYGCAARKPPKIGAPPHWKPDMPFGGHWVCDGDQYQYNEQTQRCEHK